MFVSTISSVYFFNHYNHYLHYRHNYHVNWRWDRNQKFIKMHHYHQDDDNDDGDERWVHRKIIKDLTVALFLLPIADERLNHKKEREVREKEIIKMNTLWICNHSQNIINLISTFIIIHHLQIFISFRLLFSDNNK